MIASARRAENSAASAGALGEGVDADVLGAVEEAGCFGRVVDDAKAGRPGRRFKGEARLDRDLVRRRKAGQQLAELEVVEHPARVVVVVAAPARVFELELDRHIA